MTVRIDKATYDRVAAKLGQEPVKLPKQKRGANKLEQAFMRHLEFLKSIGEIAWWGFEVITIKLADKCRFTPDFLVVYPDGKLTFFETKGGFFRDDAKVKIKVAAAQIPWARFIVVRKHKNGWSEEQIGGNLPTGA